MVGGIIKDNSWTEVNRMVYPVLHNALMKYQTCEWSYHN